MDLIYRQRGLKNHANIIILLVLYVLFFITSTLWSLEVAQLMGLVELLLDPKDLSTDGQFNVFYALIARETKLTSVLFESQVSCVLCTLPITDILFQDDCW